MDRLQALETFLRVVELGSFTAAADHLNLSKSVVSKQVAKLEAHLGARLINRTTRRFSLTEAGSAYAQAARRVLDDLAECEAALADGGAAPSGLLRVAAPLSFGQRHLAPHMPGLLAQHPGLELDISLSDRLADLVADGMDVALRIGHLQDTSLYARRLSQTRMITCASPDYLARHGRPATPMALTDHQVLGYWGSVGRTVLRYRDAAGAPVDVPPDGRLRLDSGEALAAVAMAGAGIVQLPSFIVCDDIHAGRLQPVLEDFEPAPLPISVLYPSNRYLSAKTRAFIECLRRLYSTDPPPWESPIAAAH